MAAPSTTHRGFIIPNAVDVLTDPVLAEPDKVDFNTMTNARWGVIEGCQVVSQSAKDVFVNAGSAIVDGAFVNVLPKSLQLPTPDANARFTLVIVDEKGEASLVAGADSTAPVYPNPGLKQTVLAAVYCKAGASSFADYVIDKRKFLAPTLLTKVEPTEHLIRNFDEPGTTALDPPKNHYVVYGDGRTVWANDTTLQKHPTLAKTVYVNDNIRASARVSAAGDIVAGTHITATGVISSQNLKRATSTPAAAVSHAGDIWQNTSTGKLYVYQNAGPGWEWVEITTTQSSIPCGTIISSLEIPSKMTPLGWYPLNGQTILESSLTDRLFLLQTFINGGNITGTAPNRRLRLPNLARRVMLTDHNYPNSTGGDFAYNILKLHDYHLPRHGHGVNVTAASAGTPSGNMVQSGAHGHSVGGGWHDHVVSDPGHFHMGVDDLGTVTSFIAVWEAAGNKLDALFNDRSHTYSVMPFWRTGRAHTGINILASNTHGHSISGGDHVHNLTFTALPVHDHTVTQSAWGGNAQGNAEPIDITPEYFTVFSYIRS